MTYRELIDAGARLFYTWGPNSGGWDGYLCLDGIVWEARAEQGVEVFGSQTYEEFVERYSDEQPQHHDYSKVLAYVREQLS